MKSLGKYFLGIVAGFALGFGGAALAQSVYYGWNPSTGLEVSHGADVSGGVLPVLTGCATISASVGGASAGQFVTSGTSCTLVITFPSAAPNGWSCFANDVTTPADKVVQSATTTTSCSFTGTTVAADKILWNAVGY